MITAYRPVGDLLRGWRHQRRLSQLALATEADVSARHVSFLETGRARPSREMLLHLAEQLQIPLADRNALLVAAGFAPLFPEHSLDDSAMHMAREAVDLVLAGHEPYPALAVDRHWNLITANRAIGPFLEDILPDLMRPPVNVLRLTMHPGGLAPRIANLTQWRAHLLLRLQRQIDVSGDPALADLLSEIRAFPVPDRDDLSPPDTDPIAVAVPLRLRTEHGLLSFIYTTTVFGTAVDVTLSGLAIESFFPADPATTATLRLLAGQSPPPHLTEPQRPSPLPS